MLALMKKGSFRFIQKMLFEYDKSHADDYYDPLGRVLKIGSLYKVSHYRENFFWKKEKKYTRRFVCIREKKIERMNYLNFFCLSVGKAIRLLIEVQ